MNPYNHELREADNASAYAAKRKESLLHVLNTLPCTNQRQVMLICSRIHNHVCWVRERLISFVGDERPTGLDLDGFPRPHSLLLSHFASTTLILQTHAATILSTRASPTFPSCTSFSDSPCLYSKCDAALVPCKGLLASTRSSLYSLSTDAHFILLAIADHLR